MNKEDALMEAAAVVRFRANEEAREPRITMSAASLTDGDLLEFGRSKRDGTATDAMWRHVVCVALGLTLEHDEGQNVASARKRIAMQVEHDAKYGIRWP